MQVIDNFTVLRGKHSYKAGLDRQWVADKRTAAPQSLHLPDAAGVPRRARRHQPSRLHELHAADRRARLQHEHEHSSARSCRTTGASPSDLKLLYGVRYDLYHVPGAAAERAGGAVARVQHRSQQLRRRASARCGRSVESTPVLRANTGIMYDQTIIGDLRAGAAELSAPTRARLHLHARPRPARPAFPAVLSTGAGAIAAALAVGGRSGLPGRAHRGRTTCSSSARFGERL